MGNSGLDDHKRPTFGEPRFLGNSAAGEGCHGRGARRDRGRLHRRRVGLTNRHAAHWRTQRSLCGPRHPERQPLRRDHPLVCLSLGDSPLIVPRAIMKRSQYLQAFFIMAQGSQGARTRSCPGSGWETPWQGRGIPPQTQLFHRRSTLP